MKELVGAATTIVLVSLAILFLHQLVTERPDAWEQYKQREAEEYEAEAAPYQQVMNSGHSLWEDDRQVEAVRQYKAVLLEDGRSYLGDELSIVFRRVIEYEADYGDPAEARDWCIRATNELNLKLSFTSEAAEKIWMEVTSDTERRGLPTRQWERILNR